MLDEAKIGDYVVHEAIQLAPGGMLRIEDGCGILVEACNGSLWLTQERDRRDIIVCTAAPFRLDRNGASVITTLRGGSVRLRAPVTEDYATRIVVRRTAGAEPVVACNARERRPTPFAAFADRWYRAARLARSMPTGA